jgi:hypothetical protein
MAKRKPKAAKLTGASLKVLEALLKDYQGLSRETGYSDDTGSRRLIEVVDRPTKITFGEMRASGVRGVVIYCADYKCSHSQALSADRWPDDVRLSDIEGQFTCTACDKRGADVRPDFNWNKQPVRQH